MSKSIVLTGQDFITLGQDTVRVLQNLGDGDIGHITFSDNHADMTVGKDGTAIIARNQKGRKGELVIRVLRGSDDDIFIGLMLSDYLNDSIGFFCINGSVTKQLGDGVGNYSFVTYELSAGTIMKTPEVTANVGGNTDQAISVYTIQGIVDQVFE